jgi:hypothetical protein
MSLHNNPSHLRSNNHPPSSSNATVAHPPLNITCAKVTTLRNHALNYKMSCSPVSEYRFLHAAVNSRNRQKARSMKSERLSI